MKRVFVLGAGASKSHNNELPLIGDFFKENPILSLQDAKYKSLTEYISETFITDLNKNPIDIEKIMTYLEIEIEKSNEDKYKAIKELLTMFIRETLCHIAPNDSTGDYNDFISILAAQDTVITFNWDIMLDDKLGRTELLRNRTTNYSQYKAFFDLMGPYSLTKSKLPYKEYVSDKGLLLKLHGSIDWVQCPNSLCSLYGEVSPLESYKDAHFCPYCDSKMASVMIQPVLYKKYDSYPLIKRLWNKAAKEISFADEIIIWGYSLPPTDFYAEWLFRQFSNIHLKRVAIINPNCFFYSGGAQKKNITNFLSKFHKIFAKVDFEYYENYHEYIIKKFGI